MDFLKRCSMSIVFLVILPCFATANPAFIQSASASQVRGSFLNKAFVANVTAGHLLIVGVFVDTGAPVTITDTAGSSFSQASQQTVTGDHDADVFVGIVKSSGPDTITSNAGARRNTYAMAIHEYSGATATLDSTVASAQGTGTSLASGPINTQTAGDLIFAWFTNSSTFKNE